MLPDIHVGIVNEYTRITISICINMEITSSACHTSSYIFCIVLEIHSKDRFGFPHFANLMIHIFSLFRRRHQFRNRIISYRHIMEIPYEIRSPLYHFVKIFVTSDGIQILTGVATTDSKWQLLLPENFHGMHHFPERSLASSAIGGYLKPFHTDGRNQIAHFQHFPGKRFINQCRIGKGQELTVMMLSAQRDQIVFSDQRLATCVNIHVDPQFFSLRDNGIHLVKSQVQPVSILCCPASGAVQITGTGRIQKNRPGDVTLIFLPQLFLLLPSHDRCI